MSLAKNFARQLGPRVHEIAPLVTSSFVHVTLNSAIAGVGRLPGAVATAETHLEAQGGNVDLAVREVVDHHVRLAGGQGFVTNLGGLVTAAVAIPANIAGVTVVQCRMVAAIAHLRGYDLDDARVRNAVLVCVLGEEAVGDHVQARKIPAPPMALATAPAHDPTIDDTVAGVLAGDLISRIAGKRIATQVGKRVPLVGGIVGLGTDSYVTWKIGRYAERELRPRAKR